MRSGVDQLNSPIMIYDSLLPPLIRSVYMLQSVWSAVESLCQVEAIEHTGFGDGAMCKTADGKEVLSRPFQPSVAACIGFASLHGLAEGGSSDVHQTSFCNQQNIHAHV